LRLVLRTWLYFLQLLACFRVSRVAAKAKAPNGLSWFANVLAGLPWTKEEHKQFLKVRFRGSGCLIIFDTYGSESCLVPSFILRALSCTSTKMVRLLVLAGSEALRKGKVARDIEVRIVTCC
jgi:hypothetical protein